MLIRLMGKDSLQGKGVGGLSFTHIYFQARLASIAKEQGKT